MKHDKTKESKKEEKKDSTKQSNKQEKKDSQKEAKGTAPTPKKEPTKSKKTETKDLHHDQPSSAAAVKTETKPTAAV